MLKIKNINGITNTTCKCGSWLKHWEKFSNQTASVCACITCAQTDIVGAHVQISNSEDKAWYIIPLCNFHNKFEIELPITGKMVSADKSQTCEK